MLMSLVHVGCRYEGRIKGVRKRDPLDPMYHSPWNHLHVEWDGEWASTWQLQGKHEPKYRW